jgi:hypothetical protein
VGAKSTEDEKPVVNSADVAQQVLFSLGNPVGPYMIGDTINWEEVASRYGKRFRKGTLHRVAYVERSELNTPAAHIDRSSVWVIAAEGITEPGEIITRCFLQEMADAEPESDLVLYGSFNMCDYALFADANLLHRHGVVFAFRGEPECELVASSMAEYMTKQEFIAADEKFDIDPRNSL